MEGSKKNNSNKSLTTYVAGEDDHRLSKAAQDLGLSEARRKTNWRSSWDLVFFDDTVTAARMHSVGYIGADEKIDPYGTLVLVRKRRRQAGPAGGLAQEYTHLTDLFHKPTDQETTTTTTISTALNVKRKEDEEILEEEEEEEDIVAGGSLSAAVFGIVKGTVGPGILYLPHGFYASGYGVAIPAMMLATFMYIYAAFRLLECWKIEDDRNHQVHTRLKHVQQALYSQSPLLQKQPLNNNNYGSIQQQQQPQQQQQQEFEIPTPKLLTYPELAKRAFGKYSFIVEIGIALFQFGVCLTYLIFVPANLHECIYALTGMHISKVWLLWCMIVIEIPLGWIRDIRKLTPTNVLASFLIAFGLLSVLVIAVLQGTAISSSSSSSSGQSVFVENLTTNMPFATSQWFLFIGTSFFMMEGSITLIVPLQEAVYRDQDKARFPKMNCIVTSWIVLFYIIFSLVCCAAFGSSIHTALTASLTGKLATIVQLAYSIAVIFTFPLQAFPAMEVALDMLVPSTSKQQSNNNNNDDSWKHHVFATLITILLGVIAVCSIDYLGNVVSILGSLFGIPLALVFPPLMHNVLHANTNNPWKTMNYCVVVIGFFAMAAASFNTIVTWDQGAE